MPIERNVIILDTETSHLSPYEGGEVVEIAACAVNYHNLEDHHSGVFHQYIKPSRPEKASVGALQVIGETWNIAQSKGLPGKIAWQEFINWAKSIDPSKGKNKKHLPIIIAHNIIFDTTYIKFHLDEFQIIKKDSFKNGYPWAWEWDSMFVDFLLFNADPNVHNLTLDTVLSKLNMQRDGNEHTAIEDITLLKQKIVRQMKFFRECAKRMKIT